MQGGPSLCARRRQCAGAPTATLGKHFLGVTPVLVRLLNPNPQDHVAAVIVYDRSLSSTDTANIPERFKSCVVRRLTPHAAVGVTKTEFPDVGPVPFQSLTPAYGEIISAPVSEVYVGGRRTRLADGLGILALSGSDGGERQFLPVHPRLFTPPQDEHPSARESGAPCSYTRKRRGATSLPSHRFAASL